ncbi:response regulator [Asticcacaulis sp. 201]|uniref:response regulator n=1 Tax=Asticcacaulis sp. 201 TaxID=3028787 RepID=UPI00291666FF|nr:response regulator [Asticcacaulis sp. 201]MDV6330094.1 response regulator [Asticcacaulis sp. 201]
MSPRPPSGKPGAGDLPLQRPIRRSRILVVDDNEASATTLGWAMEDYGHEVRTCFNGAEAVAMAKTFKPDVILMDLAMPVMDGLDACRHIRADDSLGRCLIIAQTAWSSPESRENTRAAGFDVHLVKPLDIEQVNGLVEAFRSSSLPHA